MASPRFPRSGELPHGRFPKASRILKRREYLEIQTAGRRVSLRHFVLILRLREEEEGPRIGITASRKVGGAVVRSRIKRLLREAFRANRGLFPNDVDVVVLVKSAPLSLKLFDVSDEFRSAEGRLRQAIGEARKARGAKTREV